MITPTRAALLSLFLLVTALTGCTMHISMIDPIPEGTVTVPVPASDAAPAASGPIAHDGTPDTGLTGRWLEDWPDRGTCQDTIQIRQTRAGFELSGEDCNNNQPYRFSNASFRGGVLRFQLVVPETGATLQYELRKSGPNTMIGAVSGDTEATVTWRRI